MPRRLKDIGPEVDLLIESMGTIAGFKITIPNAILLNMLNLLSYGSGAVATHRDLVSRAQHGGTLDAIYKANIAAVAVYLYHSYLAIRFPETMSPFNNPMAAVSAAGPLAAVGHDIILRAHRKQLMRQPEAMTDEQATELARDIIRVIDDFDDPPEVKVDKLLDLFGIERSQVDKPSWSTATMVEVATKALLFNLFYNAPPDTSSINSSINLSTLLLIYHKLVNDFGNRLRLHAVFESFRFTSNAAFVVQLAQLLSYLANDGVIDEEEGHNLMVGGTFAGAVVTAMLPAMHLCRPLTDAERNSRHWTVRMLARVNQRVDGTVRAALGFTGGVASSAINGVAAATKAGGEVVGEVAKRCVPVVTVASGCVTSTYECLAEAIGISTGEVQEVPSGRDGHPSAVVPVTSTALAASASGAGAGDQVPEEGKSGETRAALDGPEAEREGARVEIFGSTLRGHLNVIKRNLAYNYAGEIPPDGSPCEEFENVEACLTYLRTGERGRALRIFTTPQWAVRQPLPSDPSDGSDSGASQPSSEGMHPTSVGSGGSGQASVPDSPGAGGEQGRQGGAPTSSS